MALIIKHDPVSFVCAWPGTRDASGFRSCVPGQVEAAGAGCTGSLEQKRISGSSAGQPSGEGRSPVTCARPQLLPGYVPVLLSDLIILALRIPAPAVRGAQGPEVVRMTGVAVQGLAQGPALPRRGHCHLPGGDPPGCGPLQGREDAERQGLAGLRPGAAEIGEELRVVLMQGLQQPVRRLIPLLFVRGAGGGAAALAAASVTAAASGTASSVCCSGAAALRASAAGPRLSRSTAAAAAEGAAAESEGAVRRRCGPWVCLLRPGRGSVPAGLPLRAPVVRCRV